MKDRTRLPNHNEHFYRLSDFERSEIEGAKEFLFLLMRGYYEIHGRAMVNDAVEKVFYGLPFCATDIFEFSFSIKAIGNDVLAALGVARLNSDE